MSDDFDLDDFIEDFEDFESCELDPQSDFTWQRVNDGIYEYIDEEAGISDYE